jgi:hypothetical protein
MSQALREAVVAVLLADATLDGLLARDPNDPALPDDPAAAGPCLLWDQSSEAPPVFPALTYRLDTDAPDALFVPTTVGDTSQPEVWNTSATFTVWTRDKAPDTGDAIRERLRLLLHNQAIDLGDGNGRAFRSTITTTTPDIWDDKIDAHFGFVRVRFRRTLPAST